jgi:hypothetical protein
MKASQRSVRARFEKLVTEFKRKEAAEERATGIEVEFSESDEAMVDILQKMNDYELELESKKNKDVQERSTAEDMRKKATERIGKTKRQHSENNANINILQCSINRDYFNEIQC